MVKKDAPKFENAEEAVKWLDGKILAAPKGSCADQFVRLLMETKGIKPKEYLNQSLEVIATNFRAGKIDAAACWEPTASRIGDLVGENEARIAATGKVIGNIDSGTLVMRGDFMDKHPQLAEAYIKTELEAQRYMLAPENWSNVIEMLSKHATGVSKRVLWYSLYGQIPQEVGGAKERGVKAFVWTDELRKNIEDMYIFLSKEKVIKYDKPLAGTIDDSIARKVLKEAGLDVTPGFHHWTAARERPIQVGYRRGDRRSEGANNDNTQKTEFRARWRSFFDWPYTIPFQALDKEPSTLPDARRPDAFHSWLGG